MLGAEADEAIVEALCRTVNRPLRDLLERGGQRWRVPIARLSFAACGGRAEPPVALDVIELLHTASLVIDDIQDGSTERRGGPAAHVAHGTPVALGAANTAYFRALALLRESLSAGIRLRAYDMLAEEMFTAHLGQAVDLAFAVSGDVAIACFEARYRVAARAKTGALVRIAARLGAIAADASLEDEAALAEWAGEIGLAYQIRDDLEDAGGTGGDAAAGRLSFAVIAGQGAQEGDDLHARIERRCRSAAQLALDRALAALDRLPPSDAREQLRSLSRRLAGSAA